MTTIACDGKSMSGDGRTTTADMIVSMKEEKVHRLPDGSIVGSAGDAAICQAFLDWLTDGDENSNPPKTKKDFEALVLEPDGKLTYYDHRMVAMPCEVPAAVGSGAPHALTAMDMGATSKKAVEMAILRDMYSGGKIQTLKI